MNGAAQKMKFSIKDFFSKCNQICSFLRMFKENLMENFIFVQCWELWCFYGFKCNKRAYADCTEFKLYSAFAYALSGVHFDFVYIFADLKLKSKVLSHEHIW